MKVKYKRNQELIKYFKETNFSIRYSAKFCNSKFETHKLFDKHVFKTDLDFNLNLFMEDLILVKPYLEYLYKHYSKKEKDYRNGTETYGYDSIDKITSDIIYISDRWSCQFRIKWLIDLCDVNLKNIQ